MEAHVRKFVRIKNQKLKEFFAEVLGTFLMVVFALSTIAQYKLFLKENPNQPASNFLSINVGTGLGVTIGIIVVGKVSGMT